MKGWRDYRRSTLAREQCNKKKSIEQTTQLTQETEAGQLKEKETRVSSGFQRRTKNNEQGLEPQKATLNAAPKIRV